MSKIRVGIIGCGNICGIYCKNLPTFEGIELVALSDLDLDRAKALAEQYHVPKVMTPDEFLSDPEIQLVVNLTIPSVHAEVALQAIQAGKSVYNEKPLAIRRREARELLGLAREKGLRVGCAPDTVLGAGFQTARKLLDSGAIGEPVAATAFMMSGGVEHWHPNPEFFYKKGAGPLFDMGPYYLTGLFMLLGPVHRVGASARISYPTRQITSQPHAGKLIEVETPTHISANLEFSAGPLATMIMSFDVKGRHHLPNMEVYGSEGALLLPDPNTFCGPVLHRGKEDKEWREVPLEFGYQENSRGLGVADMASAIRMNRDHRCNERIAYHVLDAMHSILDSAQLGRTLELSSTTTRPEPFPLHLPPGRVDL